MKKLFGSLLLGCGIIFAGLSGLCALIFAGSAMAGSSSSSDLVSILPAALLFGGIPIAIGIGMYFGGRLLLREAKKEEEGELAQAQAQASLAAEPVRRASPPPADNAPADKD